MQLMITDHTRNTWAAVPHQKLRGRKGCMCLGGEEEREEVNHNKNIIKSLMKLILQLANLN